MTCAGENASAGAVRVYRCPVGGTAGDERRAGFCGEKAGRDTAPSGRERPARGHIPREEHDRAAGDALGNRKRARAGETVDAERNRSKNSPARLRHVPGFIGSPLQWMQTTPGRVVRMYNTRCSDATVRPCRRHYFRSGQHTAPRAAGDIARRRADSRPSVTHSRFTGPPQNARGSTHGHAARAPCITAARWVYSRLWSADGGA